MHRHERNNFLPSDIRYNRISVAKVPLESIYLSSSKQSNNDPREIRFNDDLFLFLCDKPRVTDIYAVGNTNIPLSSRVAQILTTEN